MQPATKREKLQALLGYLRTHLPGMDLSVPAAREETLESAVALFHAALAQASAVEILSGTAQAEAALANARSLLEAWSDLHYLLLHGDARENGQRYFLFAVAELSEEMEALGRPPEEIEQLAALAGGLVARYPVAWQAVADQRAGRGPQYWSGLSRTTQLREAAALAGLDPPGLGRLYKIQSWESHHVMNALRDIRVARQNDKVEVGVGFARDPAVVGEEVAGIAYQLLRSAWVTLCRTFGVPPI